MIVTYFWEFKWILSDSGQFTRYFFVFERKNLFRWLVMTVYLKR